MSDTTTTPLRFRIATASDVSALHPLVESAYRGEMSRQGWTSEADLLSGNRIDAAGLLAKITAQDGAVLVATSSVAAENNKEEELIACCELSRRPPSSAYFGLFAVSPTKQGGGIGRAVLAYAEEFCRREWGLQRLEMTVISSRVELIEWYGRRGYRRTGESRPFPFEELKVAGGAPLVEGLRFEVLEKDLGAVGAGAVIGDDVVAVSTGDSTPAVELGANDAPGLVGVGRNTV
jgi:GNAT superfamily N-acetyltransferase